ncbi:MAG: AMP-binding protein [Candidatus Riflebacteria bacterium]|nr:AMP-binding protein [Candidatus Riflebacteria bacterium]
MFSQTLNFDTIPFSEDKVAMTFAGPDGAWNDVTFGDMKKAILNGRQILWTMGFDKGDRVLLIGENHPGWLISFFAVASFGAIAMPIDGSVSDAHLQAIIKSAHPKAISASPSQVERCKKLFAGTKGLVALFENGLDVLEEKDPYTGRFKQPPVVLKEDTAAIFYKSVTTGESKSIMLSHKALCESIKVGRKISGVCPDDIMLTLLPFTHVSGFSRAALVPLAVGARIVLCSTLNPVEVMQLASEFGVKYLNISPLFAKSLLSIVIQTEMNGHGLHIIMCGAPCSPEIIRELRQRGFDVVYGYGLTEAAGCITGFNGEPAESVGKPMPGVEIKIDSPNSDGVGEILVGGAFLMTGVYQDIEETRRMMSGKLLRTGDLGYISPDGNLFIKGRMRPLVVVEGRETPDATTISPGVSSIVPPKPIVKAKPEDVILVMDRCRSILASFIHCSVVEIKPDMILSDFPQFDSLGILALTARLESVFRVSLFPIPLFMNVKNRANPDTPGLMPTVAALAAIVADKIASVPDAKPILKAKPSDLTEPFLPPESDLSRMAIEARLGLLRKCSGAALTTFLPAPDGTHLAGTVEGFIGYAQIPIGIAGPLKVNGEFATGDFYVPLATTEGALVASISRGSKLISAAGGAQVRVFADGITRVPVFMFDALDDLMAFMVWVKESHAALKTAAEATTRHGKLVTIETMPMGTSLGLLLHYTTGDASGQNICTIATQALMEFVKQQYKGRIRDQFMDCSMSGDKSCSGMNFMRNRGKKTVAEVTIPGTLVEEYLHASPDRLARFMDVATQGSLYAHGFGAQTHFADAMTALFIATGQDPACVVESASGITRLEVRGANLAASVTLPGIMLGTVGGGTRLPTQQACLQILGCVGEGKSKKLAEIAAAAVLAGELSLIGAIASDELANAHARYGRRVKPN